MSAIRHAFAPVKGAGVQFDLPARSGWRKRRGFKLHASHLAAPIVIFGLFLFIGR
jgi:hypothetical protein